MSTNSASPENTSTPYPLAMVVCDGVWRDPYTGKYTLLGIFSALGGTSFPLAHPIITVYISLTDGRGRIPIRLQLVDVDEEREPVFCKEEELDFADPRSIFEICMMFGNIQFPEPGEYRLKLFAGTEFIIERRILVVDLAAEQREKT